LDLPGALHGAWNSLPALPLDREVVVYCQRGGKVSGKVSQIAAALLRRAGLRARVLRGGHVAWRAASLPLVARIVPEPNLALVPFGAEREGTVAVAADQLDAAAHLTGWAIRRPCA
jgi:3-mercaptopyruvate sulfurtransferase SseA